MKIKVTYEYTNTFETVVDLDDSEVAKWIVDDDFDPECLDDLNDVIFDQAYIDPSFDTETGFGEFDDVEFEILVPFNSAVMTPEMTGQEQFDLES